MCVPWVFEPMTFVEVNALSIELQKPSDAYLGVFLSEPTLSLLPMFREARDKLDAEKTRGREPGCKIQKRHKIYSHAITASPLDFVLPS